MVSAVDISLSGLNAASKRLEVSANNIANQFSTKSTDANGNVTNTPYTPQRVDTISLSTGGVQAQANNVSPASTAAPDAEGNLQQVPNVDQADQLVQQNIASYDFKANLKAIKVQDDIMKSLLDITS